MNIREIAKRAEVSTATVSRVLNGNRRVNRALHERVMRVVEECNYVPNAVARSMNHGKTSILGLILPDIMNPFFPGIARGVEDAAHTRGYKVILCNTDNHKETEESYLRMLREQRVDGVIAVSASDLSEDQIHSIIPDIPIVWCDRPPHDTKYSYVVTDHQKGVQLALHHLLDLGHRKIAMIAGPDISSSRERTETFRMTLRDYGVSADAAPIVSGDYQYESGYEAMRSILSRQASGSRQTAESKVTAVFCANDMMAFGAMSAVFDAGLSVPDDISIVGYDNIPFGNWSRPALTTVSQPTYLLGVNALELMVSQLFGNEDSQTQCLVEPSLVVRKSTARVSS